MSPLILLLIACGAKSKSLSECEEIACKREVVVRLWQEDQETLITELGAITDPVEQVALVEALTEAYPGQTALLCPTLPEGAGRDRCERINIRPHLATSASSATATPSTTINTTTSGTVSSVDLTSSALARGPGMTVLIPSSAEAFATSPWENTAPRNVDCGDEASERACRAAAAQGYASDAKTEWAAGACAGIEAGQWRWECMFNAAEAAANKGSGPRARTAIELCLGTGDFLANCLAHVAMGLAQAAPPATTSKKEDWQPVLDSTEAVREVLRIRDDDLGGRVAERLWSEALHFSYRRVTEVTGNPLDLLPEEVHPHVRAAAAAQLVSLEGANDRSFDEWAARVNEVLAARATKAGPVGVGTRGIPVKNLWGQLFPGEEVFTQVLYLGQARRALGPTPKDDALVCVLEAIARAPNRPARIFTDALQHPTREVRWTAARLIQSLDSSGMYLGQILMNEDPLVRARGVQVGSLGPSAIMGGGGGPGGGMPGGGPGAGAPAPGAGSGILPQSGVPDQNLP